MIKKFLTLAVVFAAALSVGFGEEEKGKAKEKARVILPPAFKKLDADADGKVTEAEFLASPGAKKAIEDGKDPKKGFAAKDKDKSGDLTLEEFSAAPKGKGKAKASNSDFLNRIFAKTDTFGCRFFCG